METSLTPRSTSVLSARGSISSSSAPTAAGRRGIMTGVSTASAVVGAAATGFSLGARGNAAVQATLVIMGQK